METLADLNEIPIFARVVQAGSLTAAARELGLPKSTVSRKLSELEARLGTRLLQRTTRRLSLTDAGRIYYERAARIVAEIDEATLAVSRLQATPRGPIRATAPVSVAFLGPILADFLKRYPEVTVELSCTDRVVNLVEEGFDLAIRAGRLIESSLVARSLGKSQHFLVASPEYLARRGRPKTPDDLKKHDALILGAAFDRDGWRLGPEGKTVVRGSPRLVVNDFDVLREATIAGLGIAFLPAFRSTIELASGRLEHVLPKWCSPPVALHAVYASTRLLSPKVRALLDHLEASMKPPPWER